MKNSCKQSGMTLVSFMATLTIGAILTGMGVPTFIEIMERTQLESDMEELRTAFVYAKTSSKQATAPTAEDCQKLGGKYDEVQFCKYNTYINICSTNNYKYCTAGVSKMEEGFMVMRRTRVYESVWKNGPDKNKPVADGESYYFSNAWGSEGKKTLYPTKKNYHKRAKTFSVMRTFGPLSGQVKVGGAGREIGFNRHGSVIVTAKIDNAVKKTEGVYSFPYLYCNGSVGAILTVGINAPPTWAKMSDKTHAEKCGG